MEQIERSLLLQPQPGLHLARQHSLDGLVLLFTHCTSISPSVSLYLSRSSATSLSPTLDNIHPLNQTKEKQQEKAIWHITCQK